MTGRQDNAFNEMAYQMRRNLALSQVRWEYEHSRRRLMDAIARAAPRAFDASLYGEAGLQTSHEAQHAGWIRRWRGAKGV
jgi:hypothetical protein